MPGPFPCFDSTGAQGTPESPSSVGPRTQGAPRSSPTAPIVPPFALSHVPKNRRNTHPKAEPKPTLTRLGIIRIPSLPSLPYLPYATSLLHQFNFNAHLPFSTAIHPLGTAINTSLTCSPTYRCQSSSQSTLFVIVDHPFSQPLTPFQSSQSAVSGHLISLSAVPAVVHPRTRASSSPDPLP